MILRFPVAPSLNNAFATFKGRRIPSRDYKAWKALAGPMILAQWIEQGRPTFNKGYALHYRVNVNNRSDIGNREKCATDLIVATIPDFPGDQWCDEIRIVRDRTVEGCVVEVIDKEVL